MAMQSMTGFGHAASDGESWQVQVTMRAVNHRFLDQAPRLPEVCRGEENEIRRRVSDRLSRGRVEILVDVTPVAATNAQASVRSDVALALARSAESLREQGDLSGDLTLADLLRLPGVVEIRADETPWDDAASSGLLDAVDRALDQLVCARSSEGERLAAIVLEKLDDLEALVEGLEAHRPAVQEALAVALRERLAESLGGDPDTQPLPDDRWMQEVAVLADRSSVAEELERLGVHLAHMREVIEAGGPVGKRLDFLVQEVFRELNTTSAKCRSSEMTRLCVDAKVLCEELREQLRNVE